MSDTKVSIESGFKPLLGKDPKVLILGTMPSVKSLESQEYYGHPRNAFWWIMSELCGFELSSSYSERVACLLRHNIAVWDVVASCFRPGSLDSKIDKDTVTANPLPELFKKTPSLQLIVFNGQAADKLFKAFIGEQTWQGDKLVLPSTSPANAAKSKQQKLTQWALITDYLTD